MTKAEITVGLGGRDGRVLLDGVDISAYVSSLTVKVDARDMATLELTLMPRWITVKGEITPFVTPELADILDKLDWTAPGSCAQQCR